MTLERSRRSGTEVTLLMIDLERFKAINDAHGHLAGDEALRRFADNLRASARAEDVLCRYGGDEFAVIVRQRAEHTAGAALTARLEARNAGGRVESGGVEFPMPGFTVGEASFPADGETAERLVAAADEALYEQRREERAI